MSYVELLSVLSVIGGVYCDSRRTFSSLDSLPSRMLQSRTPIESDHTVLPRGCIDSLSTTQWLSRAQQDNTDAL